MGRCCSGRGIVGESVDRAFSLQAKKLKVRVTHEVTMGRWCSGGGIVGEGVDRTLTNLRSIVSSSVGVDEKFSKFEYHVFVRLMSAQIVFLAATGVPKAAKCNGKDNTDAILRPKCYI